MKNVYAIIVTYNGIKWIEKCLKSLTNSILVPQIIVIDNGSSDGTKSFITQFYKNVNLIESEVNLGFGQANNLGFKIALENNCDYAFLLNQDAWIEKDTLLKLVTSFETKHKLGILSPMHFNGTGNALDIYFSDYLKQSDSKNYLAYKDLTTTQFKTIINSSFVNAAAWLVSSACIKKIGGFDPIFFHYGEDRNYTHRTLYYGFEIGILTNAKIYHDREQRIVKTTTTQTLNFKKDWVDELNLFCDIHKKNYKTLMFRRIGRNSLLLVINLLKAKKNAIGYHYNMLQSIVVNLGKIEKSRKISLTKHFMAHL